MRSFWPVLLLWPLAPALGADATDDYLRRVRPVLHRRCVSCHGALQQKGGLRVDTARFLHQGGTGGPAVEPSDPAGSLVLEKVLEPDASLRMPPEGEPLTADEIDALRVWIAAGAPLPDQEQPQKDPREHWAYQPPVRPEIPGGGSDGVNPIDAFLEAERTARRLTTVPPLSRDLWLRRVSLDLIGLPPTPAELEAFRADESGHAWDTVVDRLLARPEHGERWARHWMDVWRYSDWYGLGTELRFSHLHIWRWRDWIIESLNEGTGYDRMVLAMLAGDEVAPEDTSTLRATGYLVRNWDIFNRNKWLDTTVEHTARAFLGVTLQCSRCHDHKFDPLPQTDYYRFRAVFEPYQFRIERLPGQPDRSKEGLVRVFDDYLDTPTRLFIRGDETRPDPNQSLAPAPPAILGGALNIQPVSLPVAAFNPDKRPFVIAEARSAADQGVAAASEGLQSARSAHGQASEALAAAREALKQAEATLAAARPDDLPAGKAAAIAAADTEARARRAMLEAEQTLRQAETKLSAARLSQGALSAVLTVEQLEDMGGRESQPAAWMQAAQAAQAAQRQLALAEAEVAVQAARRQVDLQTTALDGLLAAVTDPKDQSLQPAIARTTGALVDARAQLAAAQKRHDAATTTLSLPVTTEYQPRALEFPRAKVTYRDTPSNAPYARVSTGRRLALARWITDRGNPLAARVAVNHIWTRHFGAPLVPSMFDFGLRTPPPKHQALLDWLAVEFMDSGWNMKRLHRLMVTSQTYRLQSWGTDAQAASQAADPDNTGYWRMNPRRMEGEVIRDTLLELSGRLERRLGGPDLPTAAAEEGLRRSIYYRYSRDDRMLFLTMFDAASAEECYRRHETVVPQQALALLNSRLVGDRAVDIAARLSAELGDRPAADFVPLAFERLLGRPPGAAELREGVQGLAELTAVESAEPAPADQSAGTPADRARAALVHVLLNHNDFVTIR